MIIPSVNRPFFCRPVAVMEPEMLPQEAALVEISSVQNAVPGVTGNLNAKGKEKNKKNQDVLNMAPKSLRHYTTLRKTALWRERPSDGVQSGKHGRAGSRELHKLAREQ